MNGPSLRASRETWTPMSTDLTPLLRDRVENTIRFLSADAVQKANSGHPGAPMGLARPAFHLWDRFLQFDPGDPEFFGDYEFDYRGPTIYLTGRF